MSFKIYTKTGDDGSTALFGGRRVSKDNIRIETYGTVDELNSILGCAIAHCGSENTELAHELQEISAFLFSLGADLATPLSPAPKYPIPRTEARHVEWLETLIDKYDEELDELKNFILPGGTIVAAQLHLARTVCRRAERLAVHLASNEDIGEFPVKFLNRLSDYLFTAARIANKRLQVSDVEWRNPNI